LEMNNFISVPQNLLELGIDLKNDEPE
jgi:hypothetical protein